VGKPVPTPPPEPESAEGKRGEPESERDGERDEHPRPDPAAADPVQRVGERTRLPDDEGEHRELGGDGAEKEDAAHAPVVVLPGQVVRAEVVAWIEVGDGESRHRRSPEEEAGDDPDSRQHDQRSALR
jgi:hypothetical protein